MANNDEDLRFDVDIDETTGLNKFSCVPHKATACGECCLDFGLLNQLQSKLPPSQALPKDKVQRQAVLSNDIQSYFSSKLAPLQNASNKTSRPEFQELLARASSAEMISIGDYTLLVAYMCYTARFIPMFQGRILPSLDSLMEHLIRDFDNSTFPVMPGKALKAVAQECRAERRAAERAEKKQRKKKGKGKDREYINKKNGSDMMRSIENIMIILGENDLEDRGSFLTDVMALGEGQEESANLTELMKHTLDGVGKEDKVKITDELKNAVLAASKPMQVMLDHAKGGVSIEDYSSWNASKLVDFLQEHKLKPYPMPHQDVLVALAKEMQSFVMACMTVINNAPDDEQAAALGAQSLGLATSKDVEIIKQMNAPAKRELMMVEAQVPLQFRVDVLEEWRHGKLQDVFRLLRGEWCFRHNVQQDRSVLHHEVLQTFEGIARTFDFMTENPGKDMISTMQIFEGTESELALAVRPLKASLMSHYEKKGTRVPVPILEVEWHLAKKVNGIRSAQEFMGGLKRGTMFQSIKPKNLEEFELIVELLRENRRALDVQQNTSTELLEKHCSSKSWKFSVICPADPNRKGGYIKYCHLCQKLADKSCSRCGIAAYCSRDCQRLDWKTHKKSCIPKK